MYALVKTGGKQYRVSKDDTILVERLSAEEGEQIILNDIVMLGDGDNVTIGTCLLYTSPSPRDRTRSRMPSSA